MDRRRGVDVRGSREVQVFGAPCHSPVGCPLWVGDDGHGPRRRVSILGFWWDSPTVDDEGRVFWNRT